MTLVWVGSTLDYRSGAGTGGARGATAPHPIFGRSVNPIPIGEGRLSPPIITGTPNVFHLPAALYRIAVGLRLFIISTFSQGYALIR
jgi:hypothetical protein